jgi:dienelactone hydrolase
MRGMIGVVALLLGLSSVARAEVKTKEIEYKAGDQALQGFIAWDDAVKEKRPGILVVHEWWGHNQHARNQAIRLAQAGYVGFALDMYGKGKVATHPEDAQKFMAAATQDPKAMQARFQAALDLLKKDPHVDPEKTGAIGYCFGGRVVLEMARHGADLDLAASFHGALPPALPETPKIAARVLVFNGADDPMQTPDGVSAFVKELIAAKAAFTFVNFPGAKHSFTNPDAGKAGMPALEYNEAADKASWAMLVQALSETFPRK